MAVVQLPGAVPGRRASTRSTPEALTAPAHRAVLDGIRIAAAGPAPHGLHRRLGGRRRRGGAGRPSRPWSPQLSVDPAAGARTSTSTGLPPKPLPRQPGRRGARRPPRVGASRTRWRLAATGARTTPTLGPRRPCTGAHHDPARPRARTGAAAVRRRPREGPLDRAAATPASPTRSWRRSPPPRTPRRATGSSPGAPTARGTTVVAGRFHLCTSSPPTPSGAPTPVTAVAGPGTSSTPGRWSEEGELVLTWVDGVPPVRVVLDEPGMLPETLRERVQASVVLAETVSLGPRAQCEGRRPPRPGHREAALPGGPRQGRPVRRPGGLRPGQGRPGPGP